MGFFVTILGSSSALPTASTNPTAHLLNVNERFFLIDCGEGAQMQLRRNHIKIQRISHIFISHLHGDHYFGLIGLLTTLQLLGRQKELHVYSPPGLKPIIELQLNTPYPVAIGEREEKSFTTFPIIFHELDARKNLIIFEDEKITVSTIPLKHRIPCCGYLFREKPKPRNIIKEMLAKHKISFEQIQKLKSGEDLVKEDGAIIKNAELTSEGPPALSYAFCSDTQYNEAIIPIVKDIELLYHEATFLNEMENQAKKTAHSTALQAATIASKAHVKKLIIGHFSARYKNTELLLKEAKSVFENTVLAEEGKTYDVSSSVEVGNN